MHKLTQFSTKFRWRNMPAGILRKRFLYGKAQFFNRSAAIQMDVPSVLEKPVLKLVEINSTV